ncbi:MAG: DUF3857 domain-containing protein [Ferruginibacter sp.]
MNLRSLITGIMCLYGSQLFAQQESTVKFGKVTPEDFKPTIYSLDSNANAIVIADIGSTEIAGTTMGDLWLEFKKFERIRILNKNGYDAANIQIGLYTNGSATEELKGLHAVTYNLENGKVVETKLDMDAGIFKDNINKHLVVKKFTFPNIKEGSIIEFEYKIKSDFIFNVQPWNFQWQYPCLWSEYEVSLPDFYYYSTVSQGYQPYFISTKEEKNGYYSIPSGNNFSVAPTPRFSATLVDRRWVMKDVPALKPESYTSTIRNHLSRVEFYLSEFRYPFVQKNIIGNWEEVCQRLLKDDNFGYQLDRNNGWLEDDTRDAVKGAKDPMEKAKNIYAYIRDRMVCTNYNSLGTSKSLKSVLSSKTGSESDINLLLVSMFLKAGYEADPVMLSTRSHGYAMAMYPLLDKFNYTICRVKINDEYYLLDASHPRLGFGRLESQAYNGFVQVINPEATSMELGADQLTESRLTSTIIINGDKGTLTGTMKQDPGYNKSYEMRDQIKEKGQAQIFDEIKKEFNGDVEIKNPAIDSIDNFDVPLALQYDFDIRLNNEDILYINPMFSEAMKENPFKSTVRYYPVEMPYALDETYLLKMDVPAGYVVDELPKPLMVKLNDNDESFFEYVLSESDGSISLRSRIHIKRCFYMPEEYATLREFYNMIVKKHNEQIVFKKKK